MGRGRFHFEILKKDVEALHNHKPKYIFLTESSAVLPGYAIKEAWKQAYPGEPLPTFYRINPTYLQSVMETSRIILGQGESCYGETSQGAYSKGLREEARKRAENIRSSKTARENFQREKEEVEEFFRKRILDRDETIFVYDEEPSTGKSAGIVVGFLSNPEKWGFSSDIKVKKILMNNCGEEAFFGSNPLYNHYPFGISRENISKDVMGLHDFVSQSEYPNPTYKHKFVRGKIRGKIKTAGTLKEEEEYWNTHIVPKGYVKWQRTSKTPLDLEKKKSLEQKVSSVIAVSGILGSVLFLGSNITGNAIADLSTKTTSFLGAGLLIVGLVAGFFWIKKK
jgi:hypothetical protein